MSNRETALRLALGLWALGSVSFGAYELHRGRVASEGTRDRLDDVIVQVLRVKDSVDALKPAPQHVICPAAMSHLDHDVDFGATHECADAPGVPCLTYEGQEITGQVALARCKAGKL